MDDFAKPFPMRRPAARWHACDFRHGLTGFLALIVLAVLGASYCQAQVRVEAEAFAGSPFGVGRVTVHSGSGVRVTNIPRPGNGRILDLARRALEQVNTGDKEAVNLENAELALVEKSGRVFYPVFEKRERPVLSEFVQLPSQATILFLFTGNDPLDVTAYAPQAMANRVNVTRDAAAHDRLLRAWWADYSAAADGRDAASEYPPLVEEYLVNMLSRRLKLPLPPQAANNDLGLFQSELNLLMGTERARLEAARTILTANAPAATATANLPEELPRPLPELLNPAKSEVEPMAMQVPVECLYVRFGSFNNFQWLRHRMDEWGGELRDLVSERGLDYRLNDRMQRQLGLKEGALAGILGERVIADVALIGLDTFMSEGAAMGTLFHTRSSVLMAQDLNQQRLAQLKELRNGKQETLEIGGKQVSFFSTPDNTMRSFYVAEGDYHLVTNSRRLVELFIETAAGRHDSLGKSESFRLARATLPLSRNDTVFAFLSPEFFGNLMSAPYQIELARRLQSSVSIELARIARLAARAEGKPTLTIDDLVGGGFLPAGFGVFPDGSRLVLDGEEFVDSMRGRRGTYLPTADVRIERVTPAERATYDQLAQTYTSSWGAMDPVMLGIRREPASTAGLERVILDIQAAPLSAQHTQMLSMWLGPPSDKRIAPVKGDAISFDAVLRGGTFFSGGDHHLFGALRDADPAIALDPRVGLIGRIVGAQLEGLNGYLGAWPNPGFLQLLGGVVETRRDPAGYSRMISGATKLQVDDFTVLSFHREVLAQVAPELKFVQAERPAQAWLHAEDLAKSKLAPMLNAYGYRQSAQVMRGNTRFVNMLVEQLHVPQTAALPVAEYLLEAKMVSPLGGEYELRELPSGLKTWVATSLPDRANANQVPPDYRFPALDWLRGADLELRAIDGQLALHGELLMPAETAKPTSGGGGFQLPSLFGAKPAADAKRPAPTAAPAVTPPPPVTPAPARNPEPVGGRREF